jgi:hypothetical protein
VLHTDSKVVSSQIEKEWIAREATLEEYLALIRGMENHIKGFTVEYVERNKNTKANFLTKAIARNTPMLAEVFFHVLEDASVKTVESEARLTNIIPGEDWRAPIIAYLRHYYEPDNTTEHIRMQ